METRGVVSFWNIPFVSSRLFAKAEGDKMTQENDACRRAFEEMVTIEDIESVWGNANFGDNTDKRGIVNDTLLKYMGGYSSGQTATCICQELGLLTKKRILTKKGGRYLYEYLQDVCNTRPTPSDDAKKRALGVIDEAFERYYDEDPFYEEKVKRAIELIKTALTAGNNHPDQAVLREVVEVLEFCRIRLGGKIPEISDDEFIRRYKQALTKLKALLGEGE